MTGGKPLPHDEVVDRAVAAAAAVDAAAVVDAFVGSLATRNLPARSAFGSFAALRRLEPHPYAPSAFFTGPPAHLTGCATCGLSPEVSHFDPAAADRYPRRVQHYDAAYATADLESFPARPVDPPTDDARDRLRAILEGLRALPADAKLSDLHRPVQTTIRSNKLERTLLLEALGIAGVLKPRGFDSYRTRFVPYDERETAHPDHFYSRDTAYPLRLWTGADGVNEEAVVEWFGRYV